tara:strand:+ start:1948 stop:2313 length:366 start_codon:yes stop_codon:yes gene_type:complete
MEIYILMASLLALFQIWLIPMIININNFSWMLTSRDESLEESVLLQRANRAAKNLQESLPVFLALVLAAMATTTDVSLYACWWLGLRVAHGVIYLIGMPYLRTLAFLGSIYCLIMMGVKLL